ncbi:MAG: alpha/beta fold hydrolase [Pseudomonadota bacterium]|nr:alpha/beta fold hydrolase [Pseudomonadota bacterium]
MSTQDEPAPTTRPGPRPLGLHLMTAATTLTGAMASLPAALAGAVPWHPDLREDAERLIREMRAAGMEHMPAAILAETAGRMQATLDGIRAYRAHPWHRKPVDVPAVWRQGAARLLDYGGRPGAPVVLFVPSLVNRAYVLDLDTENSLVRWLAAEGHARPLLMDWGDPGRAERMFDCAAYLQGPLSGALEHAAALAGGPVIIIGYCMGGTLATALACLRPDAVRALGLMAAPWDFHADLSEQGRVFAASTPMWRPVLAALGEMPVDLLQAFFAALDPNLAQRKFAAFAKMDPASDKARQFVALEDWLNDGVPLAPKVAEDCLVGWYAENRPARGEWSVDGTVIDPATLRMPALVAVPSGDRIVSPASAEAVARLIPDARLIRPAAGHIGMVVGSRARRAMWEPLAEWIVSA